MPTHLFPSPSLSSRLAWHFGRISDSLEWEHLNWLALVSRLEAIGRAPDALTLIEIQQALINIPQVPEALQ